MNTDLLFNRDKVKTYTPYLLIALVVILFNLISVYGLDVLWLDDNGRYLNVANNEFPRSLLYRYFLGTFLEWYAYKIMYYSPEMVRFLYIVLYMVPVSWLIFRFAKEHMGIAINTAFTLAVLPNIVPKQTLIPAFINGSYTVYSLLLILLAFSFGLEFLRNDKNRKHVYLLISVLLFYIAGLSGPENIVFIFPALAFFILFYGENTKKKLLLIFSVLPVVIFRVYWATFVYSHRPNQPGLNDVSEILKRGYFYLEWASPVNMEEIFSPFLLSTTSIMGFGFIFIFFLASFGFIQLQRKGDIITKPAMFSKLTDRSYYLFLYLFGFIWIISTSFVFIFLSHFFSVRYFYQSHFGLYFIMVLSLSSILNFKLYKNIKASSVFFACLIIFFGAAKYSYSIDTYKPQNAAKERILNQLQTSKMPRNSQIVLSNYQYRGTGGFWRWSTGYIQYITKRNDLTGIIGPERQFYNPMQPANRGYYKDHRMNGLDLDKPIFLFKYNPEEKAFDSYKYALQWYERNENSTWRIHKFSLTNGTNATIARGEGFGEYVKWLDNDTGIKREDIIWGNSLDSDVITALNLSSKEVKTFNTAIH